MANATCCMYHVRNSPKNTASPSSTYRYDRGKRVPMTPASAAAANIANITMPMAAFGGPSTDDCGASRTGVQPIWSLMSQNAA